MLDEADKLLDLDFEKEIDQILKVRPMRMQAALLRSGCLHMSQHHHSDLSGRVLGAGLDVGNSMYYERG